MKMRVIKLTPKFLADAIQGKASNIVSNLPADVELLDLKTDLASNQVIAVIRSNTFDDVAELHQTPEFKVAFTQKTQETQSAPNVPKIAAAKPEIKQTTATKAETPTPVPAPQQNTMAVKMAGEFSPEQRKLLSFKVEGEYVIVKPQQFLKEEWEDINEVVRSLGGRWVKGDIISFWQIPLEQS
jgi:hypothetical protein